MRTSTVKSSAAVADWHSSLGLDAVFRRREVRVAATRENLSHFVRLGHVLIDRASEQLWEYDEDSKSIVKLFDEEDVPLKLSPEGVA